MTEKTEEYNTGQTFINKSEVKKNYTVLHNRVITDKNLSWEARGVLIYLLSKPPDWEVRKHNIVNQSPAGKYVVKRIIKELEESGYIVRDKKREEDGTWNWLTYVYDKPQEIATPCSPGCGESMRGKSGDIVCTDLQNTDFKSPKSGDQEQKPDVTYVDDPFEEEEERKYPKWSQPKTEFEKKVMSAIPNKKRWQKEERDSLTQLRIIEKSMTTLSTGREDYPTEWVEHVLDWYLKKNKEGYIPLKGFITSLNNAEWKAKWISKNLEPAVPGVSDRTTTIEVEMPGSFG